MVITSPEARWDDGDMWAEGYIWGYPIDFSYLGKIVFVAGGANGDPKATFVDATGDF